MKDIITIARMELQKMFYSPIAWLVLISFAIQSGIMWMNIVPNFVNRFEMGYAGAGLTIGAYANPMVGGFLYRIQETIYLFIPLITMGLMSKEFGSGSIKLLYSSPISNAQIILGKYAAVVVFCLAMTFILFLESIFGFILIKDVDFPQVMTGLLGIFLVIATYAAIGLFMSALTSYQIVAAIATFAALFALQSIGGLWQTVDFVRDITYWLSVSGRSNTFIFGMICSEDLLYFALVSGLFIAFSIYRLKGIREKSSRLVSILRYVGAFILVALVGYSSTRPSMMKYYDATETNTNTLTQNSQDIIEKFDGEIKVTTYVNIYGMGSYYFMPSSQIRDMKRFEQYQRFYPNIDFEYKYYHAVPLEEQAKKSHLRRYKGLPEDSVLQRVCNIYDMDPDKVKPADFYKGEIDLKDELYRTVRVLETKDGKRAHLRNYNDQQFLPFESQRSSAFRTLVDELPIVGFVGGHGERSVNDIGTRGYHAVAQEKPYRWSLKNNGVGFEVTDLRKPVNPKVQVLVISEARISFTQEETKNLNDYISKGGNLVVAADRKRQDGMNTLTEQFGVTFNSGQIVEYNKGFTMDLVTSNFTKEGMKLAYAFEDNIVKRDRVITMPGALALTYEQKPGFNYIPMLVTDSIVNLPKNDAKDLAALKESFAKKGKQMTAEEAQRQRYIDMMNQDEDKPEEEIKYKGSWNELKTIDFVDEISMYEPEAGELSGSLTTALALTRKVGNKEQRILILGDADCFSNGEITMRRKGIESGNADFVGGMFFWLTNEYSPIDVRRPDRPDDNVYLKKDDLGIYKIFYRFIVPLLLAATLLMIWLRRRGR